MKLPSVDFDAPPSTVTTKDVAERVLLARGLQMMRQEQPNGGLTHDELALLAPLSRSGATRLAASPRQEPGFVDKVLRVGRTIADLDESEVIDLHHVDEALELAAR